MTTTYELYTNENGTPKAVEGKAPAIIERVETLETSVESLEETLDNGVVTSVNGKTGAVSLDVGVTSFNGSKGAVTYSAPVSSVNGKTGAVTGLVTSVNGKKADASGNVAVSTSIFMPDYSKAVVVSESTSNQTYTMPYDGYLYIRFAGNSGGGYVNVVINNGAALECGRADYGNTLAYSFSASKGTSIAFNKSNLANFKLVVAPVKG